MPAPEQLVVLVGNPNVGKTTLFNALTGQNALASNFAGATVSIKEGHTRTPHGRKLRVIDLPGCYDLEGRSPDQEITRRALLGEDPQVGTPDLAVCVLDSSALERQLQLVLEVLETGLPVVIALNMIDVAEHAGIRLDPVKLSEALGTPVVPMQARGGKGIIELKQALRAPSPAAPESLPWKRGVRESRQKFVMELGPVVARRPGSGTLTLSDRIDAVLLHPIYGWLALAVTMLLVFWSIFAFAEIPMGWIESLQDWLSGVVETSLPPGDLRSLLANGIIGGVGSVVVFLPQIMLLFFFIGLMESSGYMARAAFLMDGLMAKAGLSGKAFLPLLSSYACAIPGIMAARTIDSAKERFTTIFIAPWMSCSARLPIYMLLIPLLLDAREGTWKMAVVLFFVYAIGTLSAFLAARLLRGKLGPEEKPGHFFLELPPYRVPLWRYTFRQLLSRSGAFLKKAGTIILGLSIILWALSNYPKSPTDDPGDQLAHSALGHIAEFIEPVVKPLGFDGRSGTAILTSFAAREVFNSSMFQLYHVDMDDSDESGSRQRLRDVLAKQTWPDGTKMFRPLTVLSLLLFYIYALQCMATSTIVAHELGSWMWALAQFGFMTGVAFLASLLTFQIGSLLGF